MLGLQQFGIGPGADRRAVRPAGRRVRRLILLTDGLANCGQTDAAAIAREVRAMTQPAAIDVSTIGVGVDFNRALLRTLADANGGLFHFIGDSADLRKVFEDEVESLLTPVGLDPCLSIEIPNGLRVREVFGYDHKLLDGGSRVRLELTDLRAELTQVVLLRCEVDSPDIAVDDRLQVQATLEWRDPSTAAIHSVARSASVEPCPFVAEAEGTDPLADPQVRKNYAIAWLARSMRRMAEEAAAGRLGDAARALQRGLAFADERFANRDDEDVERVRAMAQGYAATLGRRRGDG